MSAIVPRSKRTIVAESSKEKLERKLLAHERKQERHVEQKELTQKMENLMGKVDHRNSKDFLFFSLNYWRKRL